MTPQTPLIGAGMIFLPNNNKQHLMIAFFTAGPRRLLTSAFVAISLVVPAAAHPAVNPAVSVTDNGGTWTLDNGIVKAVIDKHNGAMNSLFYKGIDTMGHDQGQPGYWEQDPSSAASVGGLTNSITIDPAVNGGERAELSIKGVTGGKVQLTAVAIAVSMSMQFIHTPPPTALGALAPKAATSPRLTRPLTGLAWTPTAICSNARRRTGATAWSSTPRSSAS
jgi:hypothetical protein